MRVNEKTGSVASLAGCLLVGLAMLAALAPGARAASGFGVESFDGEFLATQAGAPATQAGSHPYSVGATVTLNSLTTLSPEGKREQTPIGHVRNIDVELPAGLIGDPSATPRCPAAVSASYVECPASTQVGFAAVRFSGPEDTPPARYPLSNVALPPGVPGFFSFDVYNYASPTVVASIRPAEPGGTDGYGLDLHIDDIPQALPVVAAGITFFGNPPNGGSGPFVTMPTSCPGRPLTLRAHVTSWEGESSEASFVVHDTAQNPLHIEGCSRVPFEPRIATGLGSGAADSPTGLDLEIDTPQSKNPEGIATANLKTTTVALPAGVSVNPSAAGGLVGCSVAQFDQFGEGRSTCPDNSKIGSMEIDAPLIPDPILGGVYLARQDENPFGSLLALYLIGEGDGIKVKLPGEVSADPGTGRLTATFDQTPQLPFESLKLHFFESARSALAAPVTCGTRTVEASLTPWSGLLPVASTGSLTTSSGPGGSACPASPAARPFDLGFEAGTASPAAGLHAPFGLVVTRPDGAQELGRIQATLPEGLLATLKGVPECAAAEAAAGTCGPATQVGSLTVGAGVGPTPFSVKGGRVYLTGPYGGAPLGLDFVVAVQAGPLDLGTVNVRAALSVDPETAQVSVRSDPLPQILQGIPLRLRSVAIGIDRPGFIVNPTSCEPTTVNGQVTSTEGAGTNLSSRFQAAGCRGLAYAPKVAPRLLGSRRALRRGGHPRLRVAVTQPAGQANLSSVALTLPRSILLDQGHIKQICTRVQFAAAACPASSIYGHAKVYTPLLGEPLEGPVYLRSSSHALPDLVFDLHGLIDIVLDGRIDSHKGGIRVSVDPIPDAPVTRFVLDMRGGARGLLQSSVDLCRSKQGRAVVKTRGQNGAVADSRPALATSCRGGGRRHL